MAEGSLMKLGDLLRGAGERLGLEGALETGAIWKQWGEIVGETVAAHAEPTSLRGGVLRVRTDSPAWATEIGYLRDAIAERANRIAGRQLVNDVRIWTSPEPIRKAPRTSAPAEPIARPRTVAATDPETAFARARAAWQKRRSKGS